MHHVLMRTFVVNSYFLYSGGNYLLSICSVYSIYLFFNRQTQHSLSREGASPPAKKKQQQHPFRCRECSVNTVFLFTGFKAFARPNISIVFGSRREHQPPPAVSCPSRFLISKLATKAHRWWKHPHALNTLTYGIHVDVSVPALSLVKCNICTCVWTKRLWCMKTEDVDVGHYDSVQSVFKVSLSHLR